MKLFHRTQPTDKSCGQTCVAMVSGQDMATVRRKFGHLHETMPSEVIRGMEGFGIRVGDQQKYTGQALPELALVRVAWVKKNSSNKLKRMGHFVIYFQGNYYNPGNTSQTIPVSPKIPQGSVIDFFYPLRTPQPIESAIANPEAIRPLPEAVSVSPVVSFVPPMIRKAAGN